MAVIVVGEKDGTATLTLARCPRCGRTLDDLSEYRIILAPLEVGPWTHHGEQATCTVRQAMEVRCVFCEKENGWAKPA